MKVNKNLNHTAAHILAAAVLQIYPKTKIGFGPAIDEGFYYDFQFETPIEDHHLAKIESKMRQIIKTGYKVQKSEPINLDNQPFKKEWIKKLQEEQKDITYYSLVHPKTKKNLFTDLCAGGHVECVSEVKHLKLLSITGAYWRGDSSNPQLTRIYGTVWETSEELATYLELLKERKERDHRKIGKAMHLFTLHPLTGQGFPIWLQDGLIIKNEIQKYIRQIEHEYGFQEVQTPAFGSQKLYELSGHWDHYKDSMYKPLDVDGEKLVMRPMTCPHHMLLYKMQRKSYRDLPIRLSEHARLYRYEKSGALIGLERVRSMELTDAHIFCRKDQIKSEIKNSYKLINKVLQKFDIQIDHVALSLNDPKDKKKFLQDPKLWSEATQYLKEVLLEMQIEYKEMVGEAAFYGPKIDFQVKTVMGHEITLSTLQLDFLLPRRFNINYVNAHEEFETPVFIHRGLIGTYERFISILLEQTKGNLPFWLAPRQITIIPISWDKHSDYARKIYTFFSNQNLRVFLDSRNERVGKKIRDAQVSKTKWQVVIGDKEVDTQTVNVRAYGSQKQDVLTKEEFLKKINV